MDETSARKLSNFLSDEYLRLAMGKSLSIKSRIQLKKKPPEIDSGQSNVIQVRERDGMLLIDFWNSINWEWVSLKCIKEKYLSWDGNPDFCLGRACCDCKIHFFESKTEIDVTIDMLESIGYLVYMMQKNCYSLFFYPKDKGTFPKGEVYPYKFDKLCSKEPDTESIGALSWYRRVNFRPTFRTKIKITKKN